MCLMGNEGFHRHQRCPQPMFCGKPCYKVIQDAVAGWRRTSSAGSNSVATGSATVTSNDKSFRWLQLFLSTGDRTLTAMWNWTATAVNDILHGVHFPKDVSSKEFKDLKAKTRALYKGECKDPDFVCLYPNVQEVMC